MLKIESATFHICATSKEHFPNDDRFIIALVGRSNVGKSSIINTITGRKELARTSASPGKTLTINFYLINDKFYLVDLPGYGYAKISKETKQKIQIMMDEFFTYCNNLIRGIMLIMDCRHMPTQHDLQMYNWLKYHKYPLITVINKVDKLSNQQLYKNKKAIQLELGVRNLISFSSVTKVGKDEVLKAIEILLSITTNKLKLHQKTKIGEKLSSNNETLISENTISNSSNSNNYNNSNNSNNSPNEEIYDKSSPDHSNLVERKLYSINYKVSTDGQDDGLEPNNSPIVQIENSNSQKLQEDLSGNESKLNFENSDEVLF